MNENYEQNPSVNTEQDIPASESSAQKRESCLQKAECFLDKHGKLLGACAAAVVAILFIIAAIFIITASANLSRMSRQQMEINEKAEEYLDNLSSSMNNSNIYDSFLDIFGHEDANDDTSDAFSDSDENNFNWEDLIDTFSSGNNSNNSNSNGFDLDDLISMFGDFIPQGN